MLERSGTMLGPCTHSRLNLVLRTVWPQHGAKLNTTSTSAVDLVIFSKATVD
jgi:hypothetical protein